MMIKYIRDIFYLVEYHYLSPAPPLGTFALNNTLSKAVEYCKTHNIQYSITEIPMLDSERFFSVFSYISPDDGKIRSHVLWGE